MNFLCRLFPRSAIHLGEGEKLLESASDFVHSDTLFSAFCHCYRLLYGSDELVVLLAQFESGKPPFLLSSAFPFIGENWLFPAPLNARWRESADRKKIKKLRWVPKQIFEQLIADDKPELPKEIHFADSDSVPRLSVDRLGHAAERGERNFFQFGQVWFKEGAGLYFLLQPRANFNPTRVRAAFNLMADEGLGGDRTAGKGLFYKPEWSENFPIKIPENPDAQVLLSLWYPRKDEQNALKQSYYNLVSRKGYLFSPDHCNYRRKSVLMVAEGSVIARTNGAPNGKLVNVTPKRNGEDLTRHKIYRYGIVLALPCLIKDKTQ